jgi:CRP/FNR family transcriptional regulator
MMKLAPPPPLPHWSESLTLVERHLSFTRRIVHAGDAVQVAGDSFTFLHIIKLGSVKAVTLAANGREQLAGVYLKGDWIGFDSIATGICPSDAYAMDTSEIWTLRYATLLQTIAGVPELLAGLHIAMSGQLARDREWRFALGTLPADARVADFVRAWAKSLNERDLRTDQITLRLTRAEIGSYLGMTLETVSRSFSRLARVGLIRFEDKGRRHFNIPSVRALIDFVELNANAQEPCLMQ